MLQDSLSSPCPASRLTRGGPSVACAGLRNSGLSTGIQIADSPRQRSTYPLATRRSPGRRPASWASVQWVDRLGRGCLRLRGRRRPEGRRALVAGSGRPRPGLGSAPGSAGPPRSVHGRRRRTTADPAPARSARPGARTSRPRRAGPAGRRAGSARLRPRGPTPEARYPRHAGATDSTQVHQPVQPTTDSTSASVASNRRAARTPSTAGST